MDNPFVFRTNLKPEEAKKASSALVSLVSNVTLHAGISSGTKINKLFPKLIDDPLPVVVFINGAGGSGKSTFIRMVDKYAESSAIELSVVDNVYGAVRKLMKRSIDDNRNLYIEDHGNALLHEREKDDAYRTFMHEVKIAWDKFNDGPMLDAFGRMIKHITRNDDPPGIIFINVREKVNIEKMTELAQEMGLLSFKLKIDRVDSSTYSNDADNKVDEIQYDMIIDNHGDELDLGVKAYVFSTFVIAANHVYGAPRSLAITNKDQLYRAIPGNDNGFFNAVSNIPDDVIDAMIRGEKLNPQDLDPEH